MENSNDRRGGAKPNAGRKKIPLEERKVQISFYVKRKNADKIRDRLGQQIKNLDKWFYGVSFTARAKKAKKGCSVMNYDYSLIAAQIKRERRQKQMDKALEIWGYVCGGIILTTYIAVWLYYI